MSGKKLRILSGLLSASLIASILSGCTNEKNYDISSSEEITNPSDTEEYIDEDMETNQQKLPEIENDIENSDKAEIEEDEERDKDNEGENVKGNNSLNMLNYLVSLSQEINDSKNSRLYLEEAYSSLMNNISPNAIDDRTLIEINSLLDILEEYRMLSVKRERLQYIYECNQAQTIKKALPDPLGVLSAVKSTNLVQLATSMIYMTIDSYTSYTSYTEALDLEYLKEGWSLDDEEASNLHESRKETFNYMVEMVNEYHLPDELALNENSVKEFVEWKNKDNLVQKINFLEAHQETYYAFGEYWITLAESYYKNDDYEKCIDAVDKYKSLDVNIWRKDYEYARILPLAIGAAQNILDEKKYINTVKRYVEELVDNSDESNWELQYFAAQTYLDLYSMTNNIQYIKKAYDITLNNVNCLVDKQKEMNKKYLSEIEKIESEKDATKDEKKEIKKYNKMIKEKRKTELVPIYDPLLLNCELLFGIAKEMDIDKEEKKEIDAILHENGENIFLVDSLDVMYRFIQEPEKKEQSIKFDGKNIEIPINYISDDAVIKLKIQKSDKVTAFDKWEIKEVNRKESEDYKTFTAIYTDSDIKKYDYSNGEKIYIEIVPKEGSEGSTLKFQYKVIKSKKFWIIPHIDFEEIKE